MGIGEVVEDDEIDISARALIGHVVHDRLLRVEPLGEHERLGVAAIRLDAIFHIRVLLVKELFGFAIDDGGTALRVVIIHPADDLVEITLRARSAVGEEIDVLAADFEHRRLLVMIVHARFAIRAEALSVGDQADLDGGIHCFHRLGIDDGRAGVFIRLEPAVHLVVELPELEAKGFLVAVARTQVRHRMAAGGQVTISDEIRGFLRALRDISELGEVETVRPRHADVFLAEVPFILLLERVEDIHAIHDLRAHRLGEHGELGHTNVVVILPAPEIRGLWLALGKRADAVAPVIERGETAAGNTQYRRADFLEWLDDLGPPTVIVVRGQQ